MQHPQRNISYLFHKFTGREVPLKEEKISYTDDAGVFHNYTSIDLADPNNSTIQEMTKVAGDNGLRLRVLWPQMKRAPDFAANRMTVSIEKAIDGKWRITDKFRIG